MVVHYFNVIRIRLYPLETHSPLSVYPNAVTTHSITSEKFEAVSRNRAQIGYRNRRIHLVELSFGHCRSALEFAAELAPEHLFASLSRNDRITTQEYYRDSFNATRQITVGVRQGNDARLEALSGRRHQLRNVRRAERRTAVLKAAALVKIF